jgi:uncharacterized coiled-coil protein SlyX
MADHAAAMKSCLELETLKKDLEEMRFTTEKKDLQLAQCTQMLKNSCIRQAEVEERSFLLNEEINMYKFMNGIQEQKISELEQAISNDRMEVPCIVSPNLCIFTNLNLV